MTNDIEKMIYEAQMKAYNQGVLDGYKSIHIAIKDWGKATKRLTISIDELGQLTTAAIEFRNNQTIEHLKSKLQ